MIQAIIVGTLFGLSAGFSPGPLLALVITQTLRYGTRNGLMVALAPLLTDIPIVILAFTLVNQLSAMGPALGLITLFGGGYVCYLAFETLRTGPIRPATSEVQPDSLLKGALVNALNPHPYLFWATVGIPFFLEARQESRMAPWLFLAVFYIFLVGSKVLIAMAVGRFRTFLQGGIYTTLMRGLGLVLAGLGILLLWKAAGHLSAL